MLLTQRRVLPGLVVTLLAAAAWQGLMPALVCAARMAVRERRPLTAGPVCVVPMAVREWLRPTAVLACAVPMAVPGWPALGPMPGTACVVPMAVPEWLGLTLARKPAPDIFPPIWAAPMAVAAWLARAVLMVLAWVDRDMVMAVPGWLVPVTAARAWVISPTAVLA
jgi:hypothetical protein